MKYVSLVQRYWPAIGGSELYMKKLAEAVASGGHDVTVFTTQAKEVDALWYKGRKSVARPDTENVNGVTVRRMPLKYLPAHGKAMLGLSMLPFKGYREKYSMPGPYVEHWMDEIAGLGSADIVHASALPFTPILNMGLRAAESLGAKSIASPFMHMAMPAKLGFGFDRPYQIELLKKYDLVLAQTEVEKAHLISGGIDEKRIRLMGLGINEDELKGGDPERFRSKYKVHDKIVFYIGAMTFDKGATHLLEASVKLWSAGERFMLVLAGQPRDDFLALAAKQSLDVKDKMLILDSVSEQDKRDLLAAGEVFAMPSRAESFGIVYLEAWNYMKPVIAARIPTSKEIIDDGKDGLLVDFGDVSGLGDCIKTLLNDPVRSQSMGAAGLQKVQSRYRWQVMEQKFIKIVKNL